MEQALALAILTIDALSAVPREDSVQSTWCQTDGIPLLNPEQVSGFVPFSNVSSFGLRLRVDRHKKANASQDPHPARSWHL